MAISKLYDLILWITPITEAFPRSLRHTLGHRIVNELLDVLRTLVEARYSRKGRPLLERANLGIDYARHLIRLSKDLKALSLDRYQHGQKLLEEVGRLIGGWRKALPGERPRTPVDESISDGSISEWSSTYSATEESRIP